MRSAKVFLVGICAVTATALAMACGGSTTDSGGGNEGDSGSSSGGSSGSSSGGGDATSSSSSGSGSGSGSSSGTGGSSGSSSGGSMGDGGLTCTPTSCGASGLCCVGGGGGGGMVTSMCVTGSTCPTGSRELCDPNNPMCPPGEMCRARMGSMYGTCRTPFDGGMGGDGGGPTEAGTD